MTGFNQIAASALTAFAILAASAIPACARADRAPASKASTAPGAS